MALLVEVSNYHMGACPLPRLPHDIKPAWDVPQAGLPELDFPIKG